MNETKAKLKYTTAVVLFGINPIFVRFTQVPSEMVALSRAVLGVITLILITLISRRKVGFLEIKKKLLLLICSGACLAINWIFLFAAYATIKVSVASLFNYMAPIIAVIISAVFLKTKINTKQIICVIMAFVGIVLVSGVFDGGEGSVGVAGVFMGVMSAFSFVCIIFCNKALKSVNPIDSVTVQLLVCILILTPYVLIRNGHFPIPTDGLSIGMLLFIGIINSGLAYLWYYGPMPYVSVQSIAILGYLEPVICVLLSVFLFKEPISIFGIIGAVMIIGATIISELNPSKRDV